jgi:GxxExxY protein
MLNQDKTGVILKCFYKVYNKLGYDFLEKVYENALSYELKKCGFQCRKQVPIKVFYEGVQVGDYYADIMVDDDVVIELKAADSLIEEHEHQLVNYLKATNIEVGLLLNFGKDPQFKRKVFSNERKKLNPDPR